MRVKVAHVRLCASAGNVCASLSPRDTGDAVRRACRGVCFLRSVPTRGIYDNMKTAVTSVFTGKERVFNRRFLVMANHYMVEPTACSPASGWEKGQVENQFRLHAVASSSRAAIYRPRGANGWLDGGVSALGKLHQQPEQKELTVAQAWAAERRCSILLSHPSTAFTRASMRKRHKPHQLRPQSLLRFLARVVRRAVQSRAYADRIVVRCRR